MIKLEELLQTLQRNKNRQIIKVKRHKGSIPQIARQEMKVQAQKNRKSPWKGNSLNGRGEQFIGLRGKILNNWQISRILLSDRTFAKSTFAYILEEKDVKIQAKSTYFSKLYNHRQSNHHVYLYQNQLPKIDRIKSLLHQKTFLPTKKIPHQYFGHINANHKSFSELNNYSNTLQS